MQFASPPPPVDRLLLSLLLAFPLHRAFVRHRGTWVCSDLRAMDDEFVPDSLAAAVIAANPFGERPVPANSKAAQSLALSTPCRILVRYVALPTSDGEGDLLALYRPDSSLDQMRSLLEGDTRLTKREISVVVHVADGINVAAISRKLGLSVSTVRNHLKSAMRKTNAHSQAQLIASLHQWTG